MRHVLEEENDLFPLVRNHMKLSRRARARARLTSRRATSSWAWARRS